MNTLDTREKLIAAAKRIRSGCPVRIDPKRKFSPCAVEDEAGVSRSTIYGVLIGTAMDPFHWRRNGPTPFVP